MPREAQQSELPRTLTELIKTATAAEWRYRADAAEGVLPTVVMVEDVGAPPTRTGRMARKKEIHDKLVKSLVLRLLSPNGVNAVAVYEDGKPVNSWVWISGFDGVVAMNVTALSAFVRGEWPPSVGDSELLSALDIDDEEAA